MSKNHNSIIITAAVVSLSTILTIPDSASLLFLDHRTCSCLRAFALAVSSPWISSLTVPHHVQSLLKRHPLREALPDHST